MLSVKTGHYHPSLENSFVNTIHTLKKDDPLTPLAVIAPTNRMLNRLQELLVVKQITSAGSNHTTSGFLNISFMNFYTTANEICRWSNTYVGRIIRQPVVYECFVLELLKQPAFNEFLCNNTQPLHALARALFQVIQDLIDANVHSDDLKEVIRESFINGAEVKKLSGVGNLYGMFRQKLKTLNIFHYSDVLRQAIPQVPDSEFLKKFKHILAYGFYDLTGIEQDFIREIFRSHSAIFFLPYQKNHYAFSYVKPFFESFVLGQACDVEELSADDRNGFSYLMDYKSEDAPAADSGLHVTDSGLNLLTTYNSQHATYNAKPVSNIHIINASGKRDEVWTVTKEILKLVDAGYKMEDIGVVARTLEPYMDSIKKIFQENYIPFVTSSLEPLEKYPLVKVIRQILLLKRENYYRPEVIELLGSPYFKIPVPDDKTVTPFPDIWDLLSRKLGIHGDIKCWLSRLKQAREMSSKASGEETLISKEDVNAEKNTHPVSLLCEGRNERLRHIFSDDEETGRRINIPAEQIEFLEHILNTLSNDLSSLPKKASWTVMSQKITRFLQDYIHIPSEGMNPEEEKRDLCIMDKLFELLDTLRILDCSHEEVTQEQFIDTFIEAYRREGLPIGLENDRGIQVLDAMSARGIPFRALFVLGLNEKVFPRAISEEPFLRDHIRRTLAEVLGNNIPEKLRGFDEERLLFYFLLNAARERLYLLYERSDEAGKPKIPSHYLMDTVQTINDTLASGKDPREKPEYEVYVPRGIKEKLCKKEFTLLTPKEIGIHMALNKIDPTTFTKVLGINSDAFVRSQSALHSVDTYHPRLTEYDGVVGNIPNWWNTWACRGFSPTTLETFGTCPFKFFMRNILELESQEEPEKIEVITPMDLGKLYHSILRNFYNTLIEKGYFKTKAKETNPIELFQCIAKKYFNDMEQRIPIPYPLLWEIKKDEIISFLTRFITWDLERIEQTGYVPAYLERVVKLYPQDTLLRLALERDNQGEFSKITCKGKIDRIDLKAEGNEVSFRVVDYKTGRPSKENLLKSAIRGQKLQLPLYILLAEYFLWEEIKKGRISQGNVNMEDASFVYIAGDIKDKHELKGIQNNTIKGVDWKDYEEQFWKTLKEFLQCIRDGIFPISPTEDPYKCEWCEFVTTCRKGNQPLRFRLEQDARLEKYREIIKLNISKKSNKSG